MEYLKRLLMGDPDGVMGRVIPYRPALVTVAGSPAAAIFLMQVAYWWFVMGRRPFYKFNAPCGHSSYRDGDSWQEELAMGRSRFEAARAAVATKVTAGTSKRAVLEVSLIVYWTDAERRTWYQLNERLLWEMLCAARGIQMGEGVAADRAPERPEVARAEAEPERCPHYQVLQESCVTLCSEKTAPDPDSSGIVNNAVTSAEPAAWRRTGAADPDPGELSSGRARAAPLRPSWWAQVDLELRGRMSRATYDRLLHACAVLERSDGIELRPPDRRAGVWLQRWQPQIQRLVEAARPGEQVPIHIRAD